MIYRVIGLMSGSAIEGVDIVFTELHENGGKWNYEILKSESFHYPESLAAKLENAVHLSAMDYQLLHNEFGHYLGRVVNRFIETNELQFKVALIASNGYRTFHVPGQKLSARIGDGATIAALTRLPVVTDMGALDIALGGQGGPMSPIGEKLFFGSDAYFLHLGDNAFISVFETTLGYIASDVCPVNSVLNKLMQKEGQGLEALDDTASTGQIQPSLLDRLNAITYYDQAFPKSLSHDFCDEFVLPIIRKSGYNTSDCIRTYIEHIVTQVRTAFLQAGITRQADATVVVTGKASFHRFLLEQLSTGLKDINSTISIPANDLVNYKEALSIALMGVLRWREEINMLHSATGASDDSVGGAMWMGQEL